MKKRERFAQGMYTARGAKMENFLPARRQTELYKIKRREKRGGEKVEAKGEIKWREGRLKGI